MVVVARYAHEMEVRVQAVCAHGNTLTQTVLRSPGLEEVFAIWCPGVSQLVSNCSAVRFGTPVAKNSPWYITNWGGNGKDKATARGVMHAQSPPRTPAALKK